MNPRAAMTACYGLTGVLNALWGAALPATDARLALGPGRLGVTLMAVAAGGLLSMPVAGRLADRYSGSRLLLTTAPAAALALTGPAAAGSFPALLVAAALLGTLFGALNVALSVQAVALEAARGRPIMSSLHGTWTLGAVIGGALVGAALHGGVGVRILSLAAAPVLAIALGGAAARSAVPAPPGLGSSPKRATAAIPVRLLVTLGLAGAAAFVTEGAATDWAGVHATRVLGAAPATGSLVYTVFFAAMTAVRFAGDAVRGHLGAATTVRTGATAAACGYALVLLSGAFPATIPVKVACALTGWVMIGAGMAVVWPVVLSALGNAGGSAAALSTVTTISYGGGLTGPALIGALAAALSLPAALTAPALLTVLVALAVPRLLTGALPAEPPTASPIPLTAGK